MLIIIYSLFLLFISTVNGEVVPATKDNFDQLIKKHSVLIVNFYAEWCRYSQLLKPIFDDASEKIAEDVKKSVGFVSINCEEQADLAQKYNINKYPTLKIIKFGEVAKREYRGQRTAEAIAEFVTKVLKTAIVHLRSEDDLEHKLDKTKNAVIAYATTPSKQFETAIKTASSFMDDCNVYIAFGDWVKNVTNKDPKFVFFEHKTGNKIDYEGDHNDIESIKKWVTDVCIPLVREITFENAEELTEEGLPFLILFRKQGDIESEKHFTDAVKRELEDQKPYINALLADGKLFAHPLHHLGKSEHDLPLIVIDSFRHMYVFKEFSDVHKSEGKLRQFVLDLHSGKLHREFHYGPETEAPKAYEDPVPTSPPESVFNKLKPSEQRYTVLNKEEL
uniref:Endoplasmic reticulum resident protein 44 (inferred by orthology to a human protein) n=1 Tax=Strongyloides venezuelensis TaxID=75913 RepID=A0A0K0FZF9_STRVS